MLALIAKVMLPLCQQNGTNMATTPKTKEEVKSYLSQLFQKVSDICDEIKSIDEDLLIESDEEFSIILSIYGTSQEIENTATRTDCILSHKWHSLQIAHFLLNEDQKEIY